MNFFSPEKNVSLRNFKLYFELSLLSSKKNSNKETQLFFSKYFSPDAPLGELYFLIPYHPAKKKEKKSNMQYFTEIPQYNPDIFT